MAQVNGQLTTCDRCGSQIFRRTTGDGEADGGFTRWNNFEPCPAGWGFVDIPIASKPQGGAVEGLRVCPECNKLWRKSVNEGFLKGTPLYLEEV